MVDRPRPGRKRRSATSTLICTTPSVPAAPPRGVVPGASETSYKSGVSIRRVLASVVGVAACAAPPASETRYPARAEGCDVAIFVEVPSMPTDNIGPVMASCDESISDADCLRTLKDQACKLGADVIWGVSDVPAKSTGKKRLSGRAAHAKAARR